MSIIEYEEEDHKIVELKLITGGKQPPMFGHPWLKELGVDAVIICKYRGTDGAFEEWRGHQYEIDAICEHAALVRLIRWDGSMKMEYKTWIIIDDFCKKWECIEVLYGGESNRTDQPPRLVDATDSEGNNSLDEEPR